MKQVKRRSLMIFAIAALLALGLLLFCARCAADGRDWVGYFGSAYYSNGTIYDRNGVLLYDAQTGAYAESKGIRSATMHLVGNQNIATSMRSVLAGRLSGYNPITGTAFGSHDLYLTIDASLNETAYKALNGKKGVVAVYNYKTGEILCLVSAPTFDPKDPPSNLDNSKYEGVYLNRFFSSTFPPGSIFKVVTTAAALEALPDWQDRRFSCTGKLELGDRTITCPVVHGTDMTLGQAFARSCNCAYAQLAVEMGGRVLLSYADKGGILKQHEISGVTTAAGSYIIGDQDGDLGWSGSGQYQDMVNPASFMMLMGGIANGGKAVVPTLLAHETISGTRIPSALGESKDTVGIWKASTCQILKDMMRSNVLEVYGQESFGVLAVCAKSGTAEVGGGHAPHAWFAGFLDDTKNPLAFVVLVENGGSGANVAGSVAATVLLQATQ